ncbi:MAG: hypothetical protein COZ06_06215 [Armatimonadetes bacterium CG_4_10_14_3_um_filter_66_18]|nr:MAG: hypothetical protein COS65_26965 [Armatimonadetes bacterium CG06_land_8_20_14_3_00_66_21]PIX45670.1 MAG: hypothetical protein COZ57_14695 [Armatimonadetes bacterium CG_4_8_14_3_um_filter_66_20]PIY51047.1 MAG: hypothetical protein COZ06_06215 [Armatimonadetes bacterium CG_4_10_14_3_um_filter_66_18]PIZ38541.1 MAG: hypothetical protein COY42_23005 [Armatimonadetes bacterium CG_4_10_14_0_8_um_filter_66_14]PJB68022.1 MAG: hypothetical protein CO096_15135 [Armatimonadetes bacterium CG_4_9_14_
MYLQHFFSMDIHPMRVRRCAGHTSGENRRWGSISPTTPARDKLCVLVASTAHALPDGRGSDLLPSSMVPLRQAADQRPAVVRWRGRRRRGEYLCSVIPRGVPMDLCRLTTCTYPLREREPEYSFRLFADVGFTKLDLWGNPPHFSADPAECDHAALESFSARYGIAIANLGSYPGAKFASDSPEEVETALQEMRDTLDLAARFGSRSIRFRPGEAEDPAIIERLVEPFRVSARYAEERGVFLGMENHKGSIAGNPDWCVELCEAVGSKHFGVLYEPCNLLHAGVDYRNALATFGEWVTHVHVKDGRVRDGGFERCHLGEGDVDAKWVFDNVEALGYTGDYALEYEICDLEPIETGLKKWLDYALGTA